MPLSAREIRANAVRRALEAHALRYDGLNYTAIGRVMGIGPARAWALAQKGARIINRRYNALTMASRMLYAGFEGNRGR